MKNRLLILIIALVVVFIGAGVWVWMNLENLQNTDAKNTNEVVTNSTSVTNTATVNTNLNLTLPNEQQGTTVLDVKGTVGGQEVHFSSMSKTETFEGDPAGPDNVFAVIFFDGVESAKVLPVKRGIESGEVMLISNRGEAAIATAKVASTAFQNDRGYVKFIVHKTASDFRLLVGAAGAAQEIKLSL